MTCNPVSPLTCGVAVTFLSYVSISIWEISRIKMITGLPREAHRPAGVHQGVFVPKQLQPAISHASWERWRVCFRHINTKSKKKKKIRQHSLQKISLKKKKKQVYLAVSSCAPFVGGAKDLRIHCLSSASSHNFHKIGSGEIISLICCVVDKSV